MGLPLLIGSLLIAVGPSSIFFVTTVSRRPYLLVISLLGFLMGIAALLLGGIVYSIWNIWATPPIYISMIVTTILFELMRPFTYKAIAYACKRLNEIEIPLTITAPTELFKMSVCVGMGAGFLNVLSIALVPLTSSGHGADYYIPQCPNISLYVLIAIESICIMLMHILWTYLTLKAYSGRYFISGLLICIWHLATGGITLLNQIQNGCFYMIAYFILCGIISIGVLCSLVASSCHLMRPSKKTA